AIDAGDNTTCAAAPVNNLDQRGITRPNNTTCDIGAYEAGTLVCGVSAGGSYTFSEQSGVVIEVVNTSDLTCLYVEEVPGNHPQATGAEDGDQLKTGTYWRISGLQDAGGTPANSFTANLTLPQAGLANPQACKYTPGAGIGWDCAADLITTSTVTRNGLTSFSDWTVGTNVPTAVSLQLFTAHPRAIGGWAGLLALVGLLAAISVRFLWRGGSRALQQQDL
ncbi:MAG: choice-of-anchor Q domain-containing protein, partial [Candidatus Promineifilaceae bacterium]